MDPLRPGDSRQIGDYRLSGRLGAGGMGEVFFGRSRGGKPVAVKLIYPLYANDAEFRRRFRFEVEACRRVGGFHTAQVVDADPNADRPWMVTSYVAGPPLNQVLADYGALPLHSMRALGAGLAEALSAIHAAGIIHRDLKPQNILLPADGPRVIDFGIARAVDASGITAQHGTPGFMAPEVLKREAVTSACDVFALGVVLAYAGGVHPFGDGPPEDIGPRVLHEEPELRDLDLSIRGLVAECLARDPADRPTPAAILDRLAEHASIAPWLPEPVQVMIAACMPPREFMVINGSPSDDLRLLAEAEQIARALPDENERAIALLHIATAAYQVDPPHAARLLDDAWHSTRSTSEAGDQRRRSLVEYLIESSPVEVGTALARSDLGLGDQMLADIAEYSRLLTHRNMGVEDETARIVATIAEAAARANPDRANQIAQVLTDRSLQAMTVARVAMVVAHTDTALAEQMTSTIAIGRGEATRPADQPAGGPMARLKKKRTRAAQAGWPTGAPSGDETARYWAVQALAEIALGVAGVDPIRMGQLHTDPNQFVRTVTMASDPWFRAPVPGRTTAWTSLARATHYLAEAEELALGLAGSSFTASGIIPSDLRAAAITAVKTAAARIDAGHADALLSEAERTARGISADSDRFEALGRVALTAARIDPARAEQISRSLLSLPHKLGELALAVALHDAARAERIAATITDEYARALVRAVLEVQAAPGDVGPRLAEAENAASGISARMIEVAMVTACADPVRAEQFIRSIESGPEILYVRSEDNQYERSATIGYQRSAEYWRARALVGLALVSLDRKRRPN